MVSLDVQTYRDHELYGGTGDKGRDVAGFLTERRHEGEWHNFQCKHYSRPLGPDYILLELGKMFYHASEGEFILPSKYVFVVPGNLTAPAMKLFDQKSEMKSALVDGWDARCSKKIVKGTTIALGDKISGLIESFDFHCVEAWGSSKIMTLPNVVYAAAKTFGDDPGDAPAGRVPEEVDLSSEHYGEQLRMVYSEHDGCEYGDAAAILAHPDHGADFRDHRRRYFDAVEFERHFSAMLDRKHVDEYRDNLLASVRDVYLSNSGLQRVRAVMTAAGAARIGGLFDKHSRTTALVRQGSCHVFANEGTMPWWKKK